MSEDEESTYKKRRGASGMSGQLYETKLVALVLFRLMHDERFEYFYLASNLDEIGCFDDLCFKVKIKGIDRPLLVFIQAKHKEDPNAYVDFDEAKHFHDSYSKVVQKFYLSSKDKKNKDKIFTGKFEDCESVFILYTNGRYNHDSNIDFKSAYTDTLNDLVATGRNGTKLECTEEIVEELADAILKEEIEALAEHFTKFLSVNQSMQSMLDDYVLRYHAILALYVVQVSEIHCDDKKPDLKYRVLIFREDFFATQDKHLVLLKNAIFKRILQSQVTGKKNKKPVVDPNLEEQLKQFLNKPCASTLSPLIGTHIEYKKEKLEFIFKRTESEQQQLENIKLSENIVEEAEAIAARNILSSLELKVPVTFGNSDLIIAEKRIDHLVTNTVKICEKFKILNGHRVVTLDETIDDGLLRVNGGLAGAVGSLLVYDANTKLLKFADNCSPQQKNAGIILEKLKEKKLSDNSIINLHEYRFYVKDVPFPLLSFDCSEIAKAILVKLVIYARQGDQNSLETILKEQIDQYHKTNDPHIQVEAESLFQNYHSNVQAWWLMKTKGPYLTKDSKIYQEAINNIFFEPKMSSLRNTFHMTKLKHIEYTSESLDTLHRLSRQIDKDEKLILAEKTFIVTDVTTLTAIKVIQYLRIHGISNYSILDLECLFNLSTEDFCALKLELKKTDKVLVILCQNLDSEKYLKEIAQVVEGKRKIAITNNTFVDMVQNAFLINKKEGETKKTDEDELISEKHSLVDLTPESQRDVMNNYNIKFQGQITTLNSFLDGTSVSYIEGTVLNKIIYNEMIEVGEMHNDANYDEISDLYQDRTVEYINYHPIYGKVSISSVDNVMDATETCFSNHLVANQQGDQLVRSILFIILLEDHVDPDSRDNEHPFSMNFNFACRLDSEKNTFSEDNVDFVAVLNDKDKNTTVVNRLTVKKKNIANKIWNVKVTLLDDSLQLKSWLKDEKVFADTLKILRLLCQGAVLDHIIRNEDLKVIEKAGYLNKQTLKPLFTEQDLQYFWSDEEGFGNDVISDDLQNDTSNNVNIDVEQEDTANDDSTDVVPKYSSSDNTTHVVQKDTDNNVVGDVKQVDTGNQVTTNVKQKDSGNVDEGGTANNDSIDAEQKNFNSDNTIRFVREDSCNKVTKDVEQEDSGNNDTEDVVQINSDSSSNILTNIEQKDFGNNVTTGYEQKDSSNSGTSDDKKHALEKFRIQFAENYFKNIPHITVAAYNLKDASIIKDKQENIDKDNKDFSNVCLDNSLSKYEDEHVHDFQIQFRCKHRIELKSFDDIQDDVVLLTAKAGLGKSTLLTHLSHKINNLHKCVWVVRINLLNYSGVFRNWHRIFCVYKESAVSDTLQTLQLMLQAGFKNKKVVVNLKESDNKVNLENCSGDDWDRFNLNMFLNYYNNERMLFIFDGFDEICPDYKCEVLQFLHIVKNYPRKNKMWITSRPYNAILPDLEKQFGRPLKIEYFNKTEQTEYLNRFWDKSINIKSKETLEALLFVISKVILIVNFKLKIICYNFYNYVVTKLQLHESLEQNPEIKSCMEEIENVHRIILNGLNSEDNEFLGTPLLLHLTASFFVNEFLDLQKLSEAEHLPINMINMYEWFIHTKLIKILFKDKYGMNIDIPYIKERCELELQQCITMHKKFGALAIFGSPIFIRNGLNLEEFKDLAPFDLSRESGKEEFIAAINRIYSGKDKTGLISYVTEDGLPVFIHKTFAEYFAVEYISDILKSDNVSYNTKKLIMTVMLSIMLKESVLNENNVVSTGSLGNWVKEKCTVDEEYQKIGEDILEKEPLINKYCGVINAVSNDILRRTYIRLINSTSDDYKDPSFKNDNIEEYLSRRRELDDNLFEMMEPHFKRKFPQFSKHINYRRWDKC